MSSTKPVPPPEHNLPPSRLVKTASLISPRRYDLAVKCRFFRHLLDGDDPDSVRVYRWHIEKRSGPRMAANIATDQWKMAVDDYVASAAALCRSMAYRGLDASHPIPIDPDRELLNGSHRLACALALELDAVPVVFMPMKVWAPSWGLEWFRDNGMDQNDLDRLGQDFKSLTSSPP